MCANGSPTREKAIYSPIPTPVFGFADRGPPGLTCARPIHPRAALMETWTTLDSLCTDAGDAVVLRRRGAIFDIRFNGWELMSNREARSEMRVGRVCWHARRSAGP